MARDWEAQFAEWAKAPSKTEQERADNAVTVVKNAVKESQKLSKRNVSVFPQGSYRNRTNIRQESDVDVGILCRDSLYYDLPTGASPASYNITTPASYSYEEFRSDVGAALKDYLGSKAVTPGTIAFDGAPGASVRKPTVRPGGSPRWPPS